MEEYKYCLKKAANSKSSFYTSFAFFAPEKKYAIASVYAFCREVDDIADSTENVYYREHALAQWHEKLNNLANLKNNKLAQALNKTIQKYHIPLDYFHHIVEGMEMDLSKKRYANNFELGDYCYKVAGAVGLITTYISGFSNDKTLSFAKKLGTALQMINILRDIREDALNNRIYLPKTLLDEFSIKEKQILSLNSSHNLTDCLQNFSAKARTNYHQALTILPKSDRANQTVSLIMGKIYYELLNKIDTKNFQVLNKRISLSSAKKIFTSWQVYRSEKLWQKTND